jgi:MFS transporter, FSR family, fosmidomycin resistance protein
VAFSPGRHFTLGLVTAVLILVLLPHHARLAPAPDAESAGRIAATPPPSQRYGFPLLFAIGVLDSGTRMCFLAFLPFVVKARGADTSMIGVALTLVFAGGAAGKLACGWLGARFGVLRSAFLTDYETPSLLLEDGP